MSSTFPAHALLTEPKSPRPVRVARALIASMVVLAIALLGVAGTPAPQARAQSRDGMETRNLATYNSQGSKWDQVRRLMGDQRNGSTRNDIVAVQESGGLPDGTEDTGVVRRAGRTRSAGRFEATEYRWRGESTREGNGNWGYYIYHLPVHEAGNNRTGMSIVTRERADDFRVLAAPGHSDRGMVGVRIGDTWYYNIHAPSGNRGAAIRYTNAMLEHVADLAYEEGTHWVVMGDFNINLLDTEHREFRPSVGYIYRSFGRTHQSGAEFDFLIADRYVHGYGGRRATGMGSDHLYPVEFRPNLVAGGGDSKMVYQLYHPEKNLSVDLRNAWQGQQAQLNEASQPNSAFSHEHLLVFDVPDQPGAMMFATRNSDGDAMCLAESTSPISTVGDSGNARVHAIVSEPCNPGDVRQYFLYRTDNRSELVTYDGGHVDNLGFTGTRFSPLIATSAKAYLALWLFGEYPKR